MKKANVNKIMLCMLVATSTVDASENRVQVDIDLSVQQFLGDTSDLSRDKFFNIHTSPTENGLGETGNIYIREILNANFGRAFWGPMSVAGSANYPDSTKAMSQGDIAKANTLLSPVNQFISNRLVVTEHPRNVIQKDNDPILGAKWAADYFKYYFSEEHRPKFYEPMNEPFVHAQDFVDGPYDPAKNQLMREHMATWFAEIGKEFDAQGIDTKLIGYSAAWPSLELWDFGHWESNQKMFMDIAGDYMDAFSVHLYDGINVTGQDTQRSGSNAEAILDLIETYSFVKWGVVKPHAITEYGGIIDGYPLAYSPEKSSQELRSYNGLLFTLLEKENNILTSIPFITGLGQWFYEANNFHPYSASVLRPNPDSIVQGKVTDFIPTEKAKFFELWSDVQGHRVKAVHQDPDLSVQAFVNGNKAFIALNNFDGNNKDIDLSLINNIDSSYAVRIKRLAVPYSQAAIYSDTVHPGTLSALTLAPYETVVLEYLYPQSVVQTIAQQTKSYYSQDYLLPIHSDMVANIHFDDVDIQQDELSFADVVMDQFPFDMTQVEAIKLELQQQEDAYIVKLQEFWGRIIAKLLAAGLTSGAEKIQSVLDFAVAEIRANGLSNPYNRTLARYEKRFAKIKNKQGDQWQSSPAFSKLLDKASRSIKLPKALQLHYAANGYNDSKELATLRVSISRKHDMTKQAKVLVNGHEVPMGDNWRGYDQIGRDDFFGTLYVSVPAKYLKEDNNVAITFPDQGGHISSVILQTSTSSELELVDVEEIKLASTEMSIKRDKQRRLHAEVYPMNATDKSITWTSSDESVATIDAYGIITPVSAGVTNITAASHNGNITQNLSLEVKDEVTLRNLVVITNDLHELNKSNNVAVSIRYVSDVDREITVNLYSPSNQVLASQKVMAYAGEDTLDVDLMLAQPLAGGTGYKIDAQLNKEGGDWRTIVDSHVFKNISVPADEIIDKTNLIGAFNPGFERGNFTDWSLAWDNVGTVQVSPDAALTGGHGLIVDTTAGRVGLLMDKAQLPQGIFKVGKKFKLSYDVKRISGNGWAGGFAFMWNDAAGWKATAQGPWFGTSASGSWFKVEKEIETGDWPDVASRLQINFQTIGQVWYLDNVRFEDITPDGNALAGVNPSFETGQITPWQAYFENNVSTVMAIAANAKSAGDYGLHITADGLKNTGITLPPAIAPQTLGLALGKTYKIAFDVKSNISNGSGWIRNVAQSSWNTRVDSWFPITTEWKRVEITRADVDWTNLTDKARLDLYINQNSGQGIDVYIDNISIKPL